MANDLTRFVVMDRGYATSCWVWTGAHNPKGYGLVGRDDGESSAIHRRMYELHIGPIPDGLELDHLCRVRDCCNPAHLEAVTHAENCRRGREHRTHCVHGHEYTPENTRAIVNSRGFTSRVCRTCIRGNRARYKAARKVREDVAA